MLQEVIDGFMQDKTDGTCPKCGEEVFAGSSDEGCAGNHWFERYYTCEKCGCSFTEHFDMVPTAITADGEV